MTSGVLALLSVLKHASFQYSDSIDGKKLYLGSCAARQGMIEIALQKTISQSNRTTSGYGKEILENISNLVVT